MAKRKKPAERSLFEELDAGDASTSSGHPSTGSGQGGGARDAAARAALLGQGGGGPGSTSNVALHEAAQARYLNYALSVITARALPDVRDGLKPVQRRILYTMWEQNLTADAKHRKCAKVVGDVMGSFHPHGDTALYETLVRMAQPFALRYPLVDGSGNFGSLDGDSAAAMRYTECRLTRISDEMLTEIEQTTVPFRPNYDGTKTEPVVLPARIPNLLVNGAAGIAVGMATNIPPHNLAEICTALVKLLDNDELSSAQLCRYVKGPDFPTGGQVLNSQEELKEIYKTGAGSIRLRGTWDIGPETRTTKTIYIESIPYQVNKAQLVERIGEIIIGRKLPQLLDVKDLSTEDVRIAVEMKKDADEKMVMAYLFKHTPLQVNFAVNLTCLIPTENAEVGRPERLDLKQILWHFLHFRLEVVTRRLEHELAALKKRIHLLEGFEVVFDALDEIIRIIRKSDGKADAATKLMKRFDLDDVQTEAILELKLYKLAKLEIDAITEELGQKTREAKRIAGILKDANKRWGIVKTELQELRDAHGDKRRTKLGGGGDEPEFSEEQFILAEDANVVVTRDGWVKRVRELKDPSQTRVREGDEVAWVLSGSTRENLVLFSNQGSAYVTRIHDIPPSTGYGEPVQKLFKFRDGEKIVGGLSLDPRLGHAGELVALSRKGLGLRFALDAHREVSTRTGRKFARPGEGDEIAFVLPVEAKDVVCVATEQAHVLLCRAEEINVLANPGKGVTVIKVGEGDRLIGAGIARGASERPLVVETAGGKTIEIGPRAYEVTSRGGKGRQMLKRSTVKWIPPEVKVMSFTPPEVN